MANVLYDKYRESCLKGEVDVVGDDIVVALVDGALYTPNTATDQFLSIITGGAIIATSDPLSSKTTTAGVFDAADVLLAAVPAGQQGDYLIIYQDTAVGSTSRLMVKIDVGGNLPVTPNGGDISIAWYASTTKIFKL